MPRPDPHSYADDAQPRTERMNLQLWMDFLSREVRGCTELLLDRRASGVLDLDTRDLRIDAVVTRDGRPVRFELGEPDPIKGQRLRLFLDGDHVRIDYRTSPGATALQWLAPEQTAGREHPFLFTQCQAIHARSVIPCQDTPRVRMRFEAEINVPRELAAVMAADAGPRLEAEEGRAVYRFEMPQPIPSYLFAFAVGDLAAKDVGPRSRVYAEPAVLDAAAWEFAEVDQHLERAERLFGPYAWDRFDILVMPPSFPYGGMENPRLTFVTPSLIAGDRSLVSVVAHELAHSWTGNLVTNASAEHFWLNEGFTVYAERRLVEALYGNAARALQTAVARAHLDADIARLSQTDPDLTRLQVDLTDHDPDAVFSTVPYEKGFLFLLRLEENVGRARFDTFLRSYIERFQFRSIRTEDLLSFLRTDFPDLIANVDVDAWIHGRGLPVDVPAVASAELAHVNGVARRWAEGQRPNPSELEHLNADAWQALLSALPQRLPLEEVQWLENQCAPSTSKNAEIRVAWLAIATRSGFTPAWSATKATLLELGRMKYLRPLYTALVDAGPEGRAMAQATFAEARDLYHPVARAMVEGIVA